MTRRIRSATLIFFYLVLSASGGVKPASTPTNKKPSTTAVQNSKNSSQFQTQSKGLTAGVQTTRDLPSAPNVDCPDQELRLDGPGGPMEKATVQDQDGLGICYASSTSLLLQAGLPNHPELSAIDLSVKAYQNSAERTKNGAYYISGTETDEEGNVYEETSLFNEYGQVCKTFNEAKKAGVCPRSFSDLETLKDLDMPGYRDPTDAQSRILHNSAMIYDSIFWNSIDDPQFQSKLAAMVPELKSLYLKKMVEIKNPTSTTGGNLQKLYETKVDEVYSNDPEKKKLALEWVTFDSHYLSSSLYLNSSDAAFNHLFSLSLKDFPELEKVMQENKDEALKAIEKDTQHKLNTDPIYAFWNGVPEVVEKSEHSKGCDVTRMSEQVRSIASSFGDLGEYVKFHQVLDSLKVADLNMILGAVAPGCLDPSNRISIPENLSCVAYAVPDPLPTYNSEKKMTNYDTIMNTTRNRILWSLKDSKKPMPVSVGICSAAITSTEEIRSQSNDPKKCEELGGGSHAITLIGARKNPKTKQCEYLVQNSWGADCENVGGRECKDGKFWMEETQLFYNADSIEKVVEKK